MGSAIQNIIDDPGYNVKSPAATIAKETACNIQKWSIENSESMQKFSKELVTSLEKVFVETVGTSRSVIKRDKLWRSYFLLRSSEEFIKNWTTFLESAIPSSSPSALFYQHVTDIVFKALIKQHYQISRECSDTATIDERERKALWYAAGYVCRHVRNKLERSRHTLKDELILCLMTLTKGGEFEESQGTDEDWTEVLDRGGLWHIRETTFHLFCAIEEEVQLQLKSLPGQTGSKKVEMMNNICGSEDVQFYWLIVSADFEIDDEEVHKILLSKIVELYLTMRGFSYASMWLERFKQQEKKSTQWSKSLRRELYTSCND